MTTYLLAIDQGTTNSRAIIFTSSSDIVAQHEMPLTQSFPFDGWVEQVPEEYYANTVTCIREVVKKANLSASEIAAIGISNQRETTLIWDANTGKPIYPAIVWQDRRTSDQCMQLATDQINTMIQQKTGLLLDPYFSATKIQWLFDNVAGARLRAERGELLFGTVDTYLLWKLTEGKVHATDMTNASRTLLFNIHTREWDDELIQLFHIPKKILPKVLENAADFGVLDKNILGVDIPIAGMAGDQQAASIGQACFHAGMVKVTYGTGGFMSLNTGETCIDSNNRLLTTIAYGIDNKVTYGLEGSIFCAGATIKWLRDGLRLIDTAAETELLAQMTRNNAGVYLVPAFTGLGAPYWDPLARGAILGLTRNSNKSHVVRAGLESVGYQTRDLLNAMVSDSKCALEILRVDGGMVVNNWLLQFIADILDVKVERPACIETSALGAAYLAGLQVGVYSSLDDIAKLWARNAQFSPQLEANLREEWYSGWKQAVHSVMS